MVGVVRTNHATRSRARQAASALMAVFLTSNSVAQIDFEGSLGAIPETICNAATFLAGPVGFAVVAVIFFIGLIRMLAGNRGGLGFILTAFVIGIVLVAAPQLIGTFTGTGGCAI